MAVIKDQLIRGSEGRPMLFDLFQQESPAPFIIYAHGFCGFKDWGNFDLIASRFHSAGFSFLKFNFSHNGTTPGAPDAFADLEAFGHNNYSRQLYDLQVIINHVKELAGDQKIFLVGHSMGGGIVIIKAAETEDIAGVATWASVAQLKTPWGNWSEERLMEWQARGVDYYHNGRTGQDLPLYYQLYKDYQENRERLDVIKAAKQLSIPLLVCHGTKDEAVPLSAAHELHAAAGNSELFTLETDHVFGRKHPWPHQHIAFPMQQVADKTIEFFLELV